MWDMLRRIVYNFRITAVRLRCSELSDAPATGEESSWGWLLLESVDTGEQGWLQLAADGKCMFPDGTAAEGDEIFDGIQDAR